MKNTANSQFMSVYTAESDALFRYCFLRTSEREVTLDLVQEAFMRLWNTLSRDPAVIKNQRAFLYTVARNLIIDWYRKKKSSSLEAIAEEGEIDAAIPLADNVRGDIEMGAEGRFLLDKIRELEEPYREVVYLRFVEGLSPGEIAEIVKESANAVSVRIHRGLEKLKQLTGYDVSTT